jgi:hypothetical protein
LCPSIPDPFDGPGILFTNHTDCVASLTLNRGCRIVLLFTVYVYSSTESADWGVKSQQMDRQLPSAASMEVRFEFDMGSTVTKAQW